MAKKMKDPEVKKAPPKMPPVSVKKGIDKDKRPAVLPPLMSYNES